MEGNTTSPRASKSAHIIDLRKSGGGSATVTPPKPRLGRTRRPKPATASVARPQKPTRPAPAKPVPAPLAAQQSTKPATAPVAQPVSDDFYETPPQRRFWPAFWRFLLLLVIFALVVCAGVYLYLKFYNS